MRQCIAWIVILAVAVGMGACTKRKEESKPAAPTPSSAAKPAPPATPEPAEGSAAQTAATLSGTTWVYDGITVTFKNESSLLLKGGMVSELAPDGLEGTYKLENGVIEVNVMDQTVSGTFDGTNLMVDGKPALRQQ